MSQDERQASAEEIEVTLEMASAGGLVIFSRSELCEDGWDELAVEVYEAMELTRRQNSPARASSGSEPPRSPAQSTRQDRQS
jgi:hypothetical protein